MPFDSNGQFIRVHNWTEDKSNNIPITASRMDAEDNGFATGLSQTLLRNGSVALTGNLKAGNHKLTGLKNGTADTDAATVGQLNTVQGNAVLLTGDQTVAGVKTFTSSPVVPTISADDNSTKVATTAWVNTTGNNVVHKTGDETISGYKTFSNITIMNGIRQYSNNVTKGTAPSSTQYINMYMTDSSQAFGDVNAMGLFRTVVNPDNTVYSQLQAFKNEAGSQVMGHIRITYDTTNNTYFASMGGSSGTNLSLTRETNNINVQTIPTMGWVNNPATSTNVVHRSGNEIIGGGKTFTSNVTQESSNPRIFLNDTDATKGTAPRSYQVSAFECNDKNGTLLGFFNVRYNTDKSIRTKIGSRKASSASDTAEAGIEVGFNSSGNPYTSAPTPTDTTTINGTQIATTGWVNSTNNNVVHKTGDETISGTKTFTNSMIITNNIHLKGDITLGTSTNTWGKQLHFQDTTGKRIARIQPMAINTTNNRVGMWVSNADNTVEKGIYIDSDGTTSAPTPAVGDNSTKIATTAWVNNLNNNVVHRSGDEIIGGSKTFTNDITIKNDVPAFWLHENDAVKGKNPQQNEEIWSIYNQDNTNNNGPEHRLGLFATHLQTSGTVWTGMAAYKNVANSTDAASIRVYYPTSGSPYTYAPNPTDTSSTSSQQIATVGWVNNPAKSTNIVHRTGDETIGGTKTFSSQAIFEKANGIQLKGTNHYYTLRSMGNTPEGCALLLDNSTSSIAFNATDNRITIGSTVIPAYAIAPTDSYSTTSGTQIATTGWVGSNFVNVAGTQTIAGTKTFSGDLVVSKSGAGTVLKNTAQTKGTAPSADVWGAVEWQDSAGKTMARIRQRYTSAKTNFIDLMCYKANSSSDTTSTSLQVVYPASGNPYITAPNSDVNGSVVTTVNKSKADNGYFQLGNGLIIQWGKTSNLNNNPNNPTITTLPKAFTSTNYKVMLTIDSGTSTYNEFGLYVVGKSTTAFTAVCRGLDGGPINKPAAFIAIGY